MARYHAFGNLAVTAPANNSFTNNGQAGDQRHGRCQCHGKVLGGRRGGRERGEHRRRLEFHSGGCAGGGRTHGLRDRDGGEDHTVATSNTNNFTVDTVPPYGPGGADPRHRRFVNNTRPYIGGTAEAYRRVAIYLDEVAVGTVTANGTGAWGFVPASRTG